MIVPGLRVLTLLSIVPIVLVVLQRPVIAQSADTDTRFVGTWLGNLSIGGGQSLRISFDISRDDAGSFAATMASPDQGATDIHVDHIIVEGDSVTLSVSVIGGVFNGLMINSQQAIAGHWKQGGVQLPLELQRVDKVEDPYRPQIPGAPLPYDETNVYFRNPDAQITLTGTLTMPSRRTPRSVLILISGSGGQNRDSEIFGHKPFLVLSDYLTRQGIAVLRFDDRGIGESTGDFATATTNDFASDVRAALSFLLARPDLDGVPIGLYGHSEGGLVGPIVAATSENVAFLVLAAAPGLSGDAIIMGQVLRQVRKHFAASGPDAENPSYESALNAALEQTRQAQQQLFDIIISEPDRDVAADQLREILLKNAKASPVPEGVDIEETISAQVSQLNSPWMRQFVAHDPLPVLTEVACPVLAIGGSKDSQVVSDENLPLIEEALTQGGNANVTVLQLEGLNHLFQTAQTGAVSEYGAVEETFAPLALDLIGEWILSVTTDPR